MPKLNEKREKWRKKSRTGPITALQLKRQGKEILGEDE